MSLFDQILALHRTLPETPPSLFLGRSVLFAADTAINVTYEGVQYFVAHPTFWMGAAHHAATFSSDPKGLGFPTLFGTPIWDLDRDWQKMCQFTDALSALAKVADI